MNHNVFRDLVPSYIEHLTSEETNRQMDQHMKKCKDCQQYLNEMKEDFLSETVLEHAKENRNIDYLKKVRSRNKKNILTIAASIVSMFLILILGYYFLFVRMWIADADDVQLAVQNQGNTVTLSFSSQNDNRHLLIKKEQVNQAYTDSMIIYEKRVDPLTPATLKDGIDITYTFINKNTLLLDNGKKKKITEEDKISIMYKDSTQEIAIKDLYDPGN
ncbi:putative zinc finger protein [Bacillus sp. 349Y]|nr:putative zinc finger protein [Bacillus sp. 349Y]